MIEYINIYNDKVRTIGDKVAFDDGNNSLTYAQLDEASARIYNYLKSNDIGREDFVMIVLSRCVKIPAAIMGVVKAAAAFVVLEDTYPAERIDYIYKDCSCRVKIDDKLYDEIMDSYTPLEGCEDMDPHDACYAVYTSGSTGNPKGVLHEYGNIEQNYQSFETWYDDDITNAAIFAPFYFVAGVIDIFHYITRGRTTYIVPHDMTRDFIAVKRFIVDNNIEEIYLPPSYLKIYTNPAPCLKVIYTGSEPANGLSYNGNPTLINFYAMSESGFVVLQANLGKAYDIAPVGNSLLDDINVCMLDEDGQIIEGAGQGELCFINEYVRGYINLPQQTESAWRGGLYHTNDCVRRDDEGRYYVIGRFDDMIKINGNRVEPVEIESHIKRLTNLKQVVAKGFKINNRTFICAYYLEEEARSLGIYEDGQLTVDMSKLSDTLPDYMIPTYYVALKAFPLLPSGKIARKNLTPPDTSDIVSEYVEPSTELERTICDMYAEVLGRDRIGLTDDFYLCGGDSMSAIVIAAKFAEAGLNIDTKALYNNRTPKELSDYYEANKTKLSIKDKPYDNSNALLAPNYSGKAFLKQAEQGEGGLFRYHMTYEVDDKALSLAYEKVVRDYPFFNLTFELRDDTVYYKELGYIPKARPLSMLDKNDHTNKPLIEIYYEDKTIVICYYHILTDGEGFFFFASTLLHEYINISHNIDEKSVVRDFDYTYDVMAQKVDVTGEYKMYELKDVYIPPEYDESKADLKTVKITLLRRDWNTIVDNLISEWDLDGIRRLKGIGGEDAFVSGYMLMHAIAKVHPDADKTLMCRFPINMRSALDKENTLRNCAMPQAFYNIDADALLHNVNSMIGPYKRVAAQTSEENVAWEVNRLVDYLRESDMDIADDKVYQYIRRANVLATNLGNIASVRDAKYVEDFSINFRPTCLMSIQSCVLGEKQVLIINQCFTDDVYIKRIAEDLSCNGLYDVTVQEVSTRG